LVTGAKRSDYISPVLRQVHWLPVRQRVMFKIQRRSFIGPYQSCPGTTCRWLSAGHWRSRKTILRSADTKTLTVNRTSSCFGDRTFAAAATRVWNCLRADLQMAELPYSWFKRSLKTFLFGPSDHGALWIFLFFNCAV